MGLSRILRGAAAVCLLVGMTVAGPTVASDAGKDGSKPYTGDRFDTYFLRKSPTRELIGYVGQERANRIRANGATATNLRWEAGTGPLVVETQKVGYQLIRAGIAANNDEWVALGLTAIEWGLQDKVLGPDANFPEEREYDTTLGHALHPRSIFLDSASHSVLMIRQARLPEALKARAEALAPAILRAGRSFISTGDADKFFKNSVNSSQLAFIAVAIHQAGLVGGDLELQARAKGYMQTLMALQGPDGAFLEKDGFDAIYQLNTLELTTAYASTLTDPVWRNAVMGYNRRGSAWFMGRVSADGVVNTTGSLRQQPCGDPILGNFAKGLDIDAIPIRLYYFAWLDGRVGRMGPIADDIQFVGQRFDHIGHCEIDDED